MSKSDSVIVVFLKAGRLETYEFSSVTNAKSFVRDLPQKHYVILIGRLATDGFEGI